MTPAALDAYYAAIEAHLTTMTPDEREWDADDLLDDEAARLDESGLSEDELARYGVALFTRYPLTYALRLRRMEREARSICATVNRANAELAEALAAMRAI